MSTTTFPTTKSTRENAPPAPAWRNACRRGITLLRRAEPYGQSSVLLTLRLMYGWFFAQAGYGKFMNLEGVTGFFESLSLPAPAFTAVLVASAELLGGILLAFGFGTRYVATVLTTVMVTAYLTAHAEEAFSSLSAFTEQEPFTYLVVSVVALVFGAGMFSVDGLLRRRSGRRERAEVD